MRWIAGLALLLALVSAAPAAAAPASSSASPRAEAAKRLAGLVRHTRALPRKAVKKPHKAALVRLAKSARRSSRRRPCRSIRVLRSYRRRLAKVRRPRVKGRTPTGASLRGRLESDALGAHVALLSLPKARRCGGSRALVTEASTSVLESDDRHLRMRVSLPTPTFAAHQVGGTEYQQLFMEGAGETGEVGKPGLPLLKSLFAVPVGADVSVRVTDTNGFDVPGVNLYPHQPDPVDQEGRPPLETFMEDPFVKSRRTYRARRSFPSKVAGASLLGNMRDLRIGGLELVAARYRPDLKRLHVFTAIDVTVEFGGGNQGTFGDATLIGSPWEAYFARNYDRMLENGATALGDLTALPAKPWCGADMLVITSNGLRPAANAFANARKAAGYHPTVVEVGSAPGQIGSSLAEIQAYILNQLNADCEVRPSYVVLFGDTSHVPTWHVPCEEGGDLAECDIASDLPYSLNFPSDLFADVMLGRIPAHDLASANAVVNKIVAYETTAPAPPADDFFHHATVTAFFEPKYLCILNEGQSGEPNCKSKNGPVTGHWELDATNTQDTRGFTKTAETIQNRMEADGITTDRVYTTLESVSPETYYDGTPIPDFLRKPTFAWNGTGADLLGHYNAGRALILHRDHGWKDGWADPTLHNGDVPQMVNGSQLPVVFGVNCSSAQFDIPGDPSFVERQVMKPDGGAFAGFGDTRVSPTWPNNHMAYGFFDAMFPDLRPSFGAEEPTARLGDILLSGKGYMAAKNEGAAEWKEHYLYHLLGDPSAQAWVRTPKEIDVTRIVVERIPIPVPDPGGPVFRVRVNMGDQGAATPTVVTLLERGEPIGRGVVGQGVVEITPEVAVRPVNLTVVFEQDHALPAGKAVETR